MEKVAKKALLSISDYSPAKRVVVRTDINAWN